MQENNLFVDLGLPSGTLWATCNVGADEPEENGDYFAWGEVHTKHWMKFREDGYTYDQNPDVLPPENDAAYVLLGENFRMPTRKEFEELLEECEWITIYESIYFVGYKIVGPNGNSIYLPAAPGIDSTVFSNLSEEEWGKYENSDIREVEEFMEEYCGLSHGSYWSSSIDKDDKINASAFIFREETPEDWPRNDTEYPHGWVCGNIRCDGMAIRPVKNK